MSRFGVTIHERDEFWFGEGYVQINDKLTGVYYVSCILNKDHALEMTKVLNDHYPKPPHPADCDVDPDSLTFKRDLAKGEIFKICGECRQKLEVSEKKS